MQVELVDTTARDGVALSGALLQPPMPEHSSALPIDAVICLHGTGSNFYSSSLWRGLLSTFRAWNVPTLLVNTRGHDGITTARATDGRRWFGSAFELVDECRHDVAGWVAFGAERGWQRVCLVGHSLGAVKAIYAMACESFPTVRCVAAVSPPRLSHTTFKTSPRGSEFMAEYQQAVDLVARGNAASIMDVQYPLPYYVSAAGYLDKYGPEERYNILSFVDRVRVPMLFTYGTAELGGMAFAGMPEALEEKSSAEVNLKVAVIAGADHVYSTVQSTLGGRMESWLRKLA